MLFALSILTFALQVLTENAIERTASLVVLPPLVLGYDDLYDDDPPKRQPHQPKQPQQPDQPQEPYQSNPPHLPPNPPTADDQTISPEESQPKLSTETSEKYPPEPPIIIHPEDYKESAETDLTGQAEHQPVTSPAERQRPYSFRNRVRGQSPKFGHREIQRPSGGRNRFSEHNMRTRDYARGRHYARLESRNLN